MATGYKHGIYTFEKPTNILPPRNVESAVIFAVGTSAAHKTANPCVNKARCFYSLDEYVAEMGWDDVDWEKYSLQELVYSHFSLYRGAPIICVNVFDPQIHASQAENEFVRFSTALLTKDMAILAHAGVCNLELKNSDGTVPYLLGSDYEIDALNGVITRLETGSIPEGAECVASYIYGDADKVGSADVIGGVDINGNASGLELIDTVYPEFSLVPSIVVAPRFSEDPDVAVVMAAKCEGVNNLFKAVSIVDIPTSGPNAVTKYQDAVAYKNRNNLTDPLMIVCWPKLKLANNVYHLSTHIAGLMADTDEEHGGIPYASPSNKRLNATSCGFVDSSGNWQELWLDLTKSNYLNGNGIYTAQSFDGGLKSWGGRMACYPSNTDPKDAFDAVRRFFNWYQAQFILTYFNKIDEPMTKRFVQTILKSEQIKLDGYTSMEIILGGNISFDESENPLTDLIDGIMRFSIRITPPVLARDVEATFEFDPENLKALFA